MSEPFERERRVGEYAGVGLGLFVLAAAIGSSLAGLAVLDAFAWLDDHTPFPPVAIRATGEFLACVPLLALPALALVWVRRRYGRCRIVGNDATFEPPLAGALEFTLENVAARRVTPHGVLVEVPGRSAQAKLLCPLLIPTETDAQVAEVLARLDACPVHLPYVRRPQSVAHHVALAFAVAIPFLIQFFVVPAFKTMFEETGIALPLLTEQLIVGRLLVWGAAGHVFAIAVGGTWAPRRVLGGAWLVSAVYLGPVVTALFLPLIQITEKL